MVNRKHWNHWSLSFSCKKQNVSKDFPILTDYFYSFMQYSFRFQNSPRYFKLKEKWRRQSSNKFLTTNVYNIHVHCTVGRGDDGSMFVHVHVTQNFGIYMYTKAWSLFTPQISQIGQILHNSYAFAYL